MLLAAPGLLALVAEPAVWLARTWSDPAYQSDGALVALVALALALRSLASGRAAANPAAQRFAWWLLLATAVLRLAGRLLAVRTIGALALVVDVGALALFLGLGRRPWAVHPGVLAVFSALALPAEHLLQRLLGHPLQLLASALAEQALLPFFPALVRTGVLLSHPGIELAVDLPCSGARGLVLLTGLATALWCRRRATPVEIALAGLAVVGGALLANTLRIVGLFLAAATGLPVALEPWHTALGVAALVVGALPILAIVARLPSRNGNGKPATAEATATKTQWRTLGWPAALLTSALGIGVALAPEHPIDVSRSAFTPRLPASLGVLRGRPVALQEQERSYYARYGGGVEKRTYDDGSVAHTALLVRTQAPLRHLHGPDRCLLGAGHEVTRLGVRAGAGAIPSVIYRSVAPDGRAWRVEASFVSDAGVSASGVSEVVWRWLERPGDGWNLIERISAWEICERAPERCRSFDRALFTALDLPAARLP